MANIIPLSISSSEYTTVKSTFTSKMALKYNIQIHSIIRVEMPKHIINNHKAYKKNNPNLRCAQYFHGTKHVCAIRSLNNSNFCQPNVACSVCGIIRTGFKLNNGGVWFSPDAWYSHSYTNLGPDSSRTMFIVDVVGAANSSGSENYVAYAENIDISIYAVGDYATLSNRIFGLSYSIR
ncbi:poly ADP-ribose polymerase 12-like [Gigaspora margarita]|uniref:Poly ADP-ribose polymerase 12-like n=1 Tax=Gigaspora margarita TaxID=4874 RepID=A0A8H3XI85_GIGMA|nr:poly ADP-ribose polymerase 12-like [Gigaspora margarita]